MHVYYFGCPANTRGAHGCCRGGNRPRGVAAAAQPVADRVYRHAGDVYGGAGHFHCQHRAATHRGKFWREHERVDVGTDELSSLERHRAADQRVACDANRAKAILHVVRGAFCRKQFSLRLRADVGDARLFPSAARDGRRRIAAERAVHSGGYVHAAAARHGVFDLRNGGRPGSGDRPHNRRLDYGQLQLAVDFLYQRADQHHIAIPHLPIRRGPAIPQRGAHKSNQGRNRLRGPGTCGPGGWLSADGDGQGTGARLVRFALDHSGLHCGVRYLSCLGHMGMAPFRIRSWN